MKPSSSINRALRSVLALSAAALLAGGALSACASDDSDNSTSANDAGSTTSLTANPASGAPIKVGYITPEGGTVTIPAVREAGTAAVKYLNENGGGIGGHKVDLIVCKEQEEPASATKCANQMVEQKVDVVLTPFSSQGAVMVPIITRAGIAYIAQAPVSSAEMSSANTFMLTGGQVGVLMGQAATAAKAGYKKVTLLIGDVGDAAASVKALGEPLFKAAGVTLNVVTVPVSVADPTPQITAALADKPDAVTILGDSRQCISGLKAIQSVAPTMQKYLISSCIDSTVVDAVGKETVKGAKAFTSVNVDDKAQTSEQYRSIMAAYAPKTDPAGLAYLGYQVVMGFANAATTLTGDVSPASVIKTMQTAKDVQLPAAPGITFTCNGSAMPQLKTLCSKAILVSDVDANGRMTNTTAVNN